MLDVDYQYMAMIKNLERRGWVRHEFPPMHPKVWDKISQAIGYENQRVVIWRSVANPRTGHCTSMSGILLISPQGKENLDRFLRTIES